MKKKLALLLACSMALSLTACGGGNKAAETMAAPETTTAAAAEAAKEESRDDAAETTAAEAAGGDMDALIEAVQIREVNIYHSHSCGRIILEYDLAVYALATLVRIVGTMISQIGRAHV